MRRWLMCILFVAVSSVSYGDVTSKEARHRLPPVVYSLDIPHTVEVGQDYEWNWTAMGYHERYDVIILVNDRNGTQVARKTVEPDKKTEGAFHYRDVQSNQFHYSTTFSIDEDAITSFPAEQDNVSQDLILRFFARPPNDPIDTNFLSLLIPSGLGYRAAGTSGRKIHINALKGAARPRDVYLNPDGVSYLASPGGREHNWRKGTGSPQHYAVDEFSADWNWGSRYKDDGKEFHSMMGGRVIFTGLMYQKNGRPQPFEQEPDNVTFGKQVIVYNERTKMAVRYAHLSSIDVERVPQHTSLDEGSCRDDIGNCSRVHVSEQIGAIGNTGGDFTPHLHMTLYKNVDSDALDNLQRGRWPNGDAIDTGNWTNYSTKFNVVGEP